jgi:protein-L-isoaspartate(D-aspartate) O-methyltransferase
VSDLAEARDLMVERQLARRGISDPRVLSAARVVPRHAFLRSGLAGCAYDDHPLPIGSGQTISQPFVVARMAEAAELSPDDRVLEVGTGSGYAAALLSWLVDRVYTIERHAELGEGARRVLQEQGYGNIEVRIGDGTLGWPEAAPFDAILVAAGGPFVPAALKRQLKKGGRLVMPVGGQNAVQKLVKLVRRGPDVFDEADLGGVMFVPLVGAQGWPVSQDLS